MAFPSSMKYENRVFDKAKLLEVTIDEDDLMSFFVKMDIGDDGNPVYPADKLASLVMRVLPEYVFAGHEDIDLQTTMAKVAEAAEKLYNTDPYKKMQRYYIDNDVSVKEDVKKLEANNRGEFGELLLHLLLRDFKGTLPLMSKVYFSDSRGVPAHGFDAVHFVAETKQLWLGESKLYSEAKTGLDALVQDLRDHIKYDYMHEQFAIIKKNVESQNFPEKDYWVKELQKNERLADMISDLNIVMLCLFPQDVYQRCLNKELDEVKGIEYHKTHIRDLKSYFDSINDCPVKDKVNIVLFLFPVLDKKEFVRKLHQKLWHIQQI